MLLIDLAEGRVISDEEVKYRIAGCRLYRKWLRTNVVTLPAACATSSPLFTEPVLDRLKALHGYTLEDLRILMVPMARHGNEAIGSMGNDTALAVLSDRLRLLYDYFKRLFAQVTNPPLDAIREMMVTSLALDLGASRNLYTESPLHCRKLRLNQPVLIECALTNLRQCGLAWATVSTCIDEDGLEHALARVREEAADAVRQGAQLIILSDRKARRARMPTPALLVVAAVYHYLIR